MATELDQKQQVLTQIYQLQAYTPKIKGHLLNVVILVHTHQLTQKQSHTILFTNDLGLGAQAVIEYYCLRFQIEFDFRDAKQFYGLSDFKNYHQLQVSNAVNLAFTMTVVGKLLLAKYKARLGCGTMGLLDLKSVFRVSKYAQLLLKSDRLGADAFLNSPEFLSLARLEAIHI